MSAPNITQETWEAAKALFLEALALPRESRGPFLESRCRGEPELLAHVASLLDHEEAAPEIVVDPGAAMEQWLGARSVRVAPPAPEAGRVVGSCKLISLLGEGATGLVYLAEQARPRRKVALKIVRPGAASAAALRRLEREAEIMARLRHPGIAQVIESGTDAAGPFVVMEYVQGAPITRFVRERATPTLDRLQLFLLICDAVQHAHSMGVIHRDLKPANILVTPSGQPKILDFGVARATDLDPHHATLATSMGQLVGTLAYMSPEQAAGETDAPDVRADIYALGVILFELLAERPPHDLRGMPLHEALRAIQSDPIPRLGSIVRACRGDLEIIAAKALDREPGRRYGSVSEFAADVRRHLDRLPILARSPSAFYEMTRLAQRRRPLVIGIGVALVGIVSALAWSLVAQRREHEDYLIVRSVAGSWLADVMTDLGPMSGTYKARSRMVADLRAPLERFAQRHPNDLDVQGNLAALEFASAEVDRETGDYDAALPRFGRAFEILSRLVSEHPKEAKWRLQRAVAAVKIGDMIRAREQTHAAIAWYEAALALDIASASEFPDNYTALDQLVWSYHRLAFMAAQNQNDADALRYCDNMEETAAQLVARWPDRDKALWCRIGAMQMRAHITSTCGRDEASVAMRRESIELGRRLVTITPDNRGYTTNQIFTLCDFADRKLRQEELPAAEALLASALPLVRRALDLDGHDRTSHDAAVSYYTRVRRLHVLAREIPQALEASARAARHARCAVNADPTSRDAANVLLRVQRRHFELLRETRHHPDIQRAGCDLRDDAVLAISRFPTCTQAWMHLAAVSISAEPMLRDLDLAANAAQRVLELSGPDDADAKRLLADVRAQRR